MFLAALHRIPPLLPRKRDTKAMQGVLPNHGLPLGWGREKGADSCPAPQENTAHPVPPHAQAHTPSARCTFDSSTGSCQQLWHSPSLLVYLNQHIHSTSWGLLFKTLLLKTTLLWQTKDHKVAELNTDGRAKASMCPPTSFLPFSESISTLNAQARHAVHLVWHGPPQGTDKGREMVPAQAIPGYHRQCSLGSCMPIHPSLTPAGKRNYPGRRTAARAACVPRQHWQTLPVPKLSCWEWWTLTNWEYQGREASADSRRPGRCEEHTWLQCFILLPSLRVPSFFINSVWTWISDKPTASWVVKVDGKRSDYLPWGN